MSAPPLEATLQPVFSPSHKPNWSLLGLGLALAGVAGVAATIPWAGYDNQAPALLSGSNSAVLRLLFILLSYLFVGIAAYGRTGDGWATAIAITAGAALGWSGWEWSTLSPGWVVFGALVLLLNRRQRFTPSLAAAATVLWALFDSTAAWGVLLLLAYTLTQRSGIERLQLGAGGLLGVGGLLARGIDPRRVLVPPARAWVWADGQATTSFGDPVGLALFMILVALLGLALLRGGKATGGNFVALAVFAALAWHARRNGIWLSLVAVPIIAATFAGRHAGRHAQRAPGMTPGMAPDLPDDILSRVPRWGILGAATALSSGLLLLALTMAPPLIGGQPLPPAALEELPQRGTIVYRPEFAPTLVQARPHAGLSILDRMLHSEAEFKQAYSTWERIATNCDPLTELETLDARAVVLDSRQEAATIATLAADARWRVSWQDSNATVLTRLGEQP